MRAGSNLANGTILNNSARVVFAPANGTNGSVNVSETTTIRGIPVIITNKTDSPDPIPRGTTLSYQITVNNTGDEVASQADSDQDPNGVPFPDGSPGDLFAEVQIRIPAELTAEERAAIEQIEKQHPINPRQELSW